MYEFNYNPAFSSFTYILLVVHYSKHACWLTKIVGRVGVRKGIQSCPIPKNYCGEAFNSIIYKDVKPMTLMIILMFDLYVVLT